MFEPTPIQSKLLKAVQNVATERHRLIGKSGTAGILDLTPGDRAHLETVRRTGNELEALAAAVGVPQSVIDYTRAAGERGHGWRPGQPLLNTEVIDRDTVVAGHLRSVWQLQTMAGVGAAIAQQGTLPRDGFDAFRRVMGASWQRVGALGHALDLTQREREHAWEPGSPPWTERVAETVESMERSALTARWRGIVETDFVAATIPVTVLTAAGSPLMTSAANYRSCRIGWSSSLHWPCDRNPRCTRSSALASAPRSRSPASTPTPNPNPTTPPGRQRIEAATTTLAPTRDASTSHSHRSSKERPSN